LGSSSALPANNRFPTAQILDCNQQYYLIDCGEGAQMQMRKYRIKIQRIKAVFISHLHGDHYFGLLGLLNSMQLLGRTSKLNIICPAKLKDIFELQMEAGGGRFQFPIHYTFTDEIVESVGDTLVYSDANLSVTAFPLKHRIPCSGFLFKQQKKQRTFKKESLNLFGVPIKLIQEIKDGADFIMEDGTIIPNALMTIDPPAPKTYAYCTDTLPMAETSAYVKGCDTLYHEATFAEADVTRAKQTFHSTAKQAAIVAKNAEVRQLLIGHFSARYLDLELLENEARTEFLNSFLAIEGKLFEI